MDFKAMRKAEKARARAERRKAEAAVHGESEKVPHSLPLPVMNDLGGGISYCNDFLTVQEASDLVSSIDSIPSTDWVTLTHRRLLNLGGVPHPSGSWTEPLPAKITNLVTDRLVALGVFPEDAPPNQVLLNEYRDGEGIDPHKDGPLYQRLACIVSLESDAVIDFSPDKVECGEKDGTIPKRSVVLRRNSCLSFTGEAYDCYKHGIMTRHSDVVGPEVINIAEANVELGEEILRGHPRRLSLTLRRLGRVERHFDEFDVVTTEDEVEKKRREAWWFRSISEK